MTARAPSVLLPPDLYWMSEKLAHTKNDAKGVTQCVCTGKLGWEAEGSCCIPCKAVVAGPNSISHYNFLQQFRMYQSPPQECIEVEFTTSIILWHRKKGRRQHGTISRLRTPVLLWYAPPNNVHSTTLSRAYEDTRWKCVFDNLVV